MRVYYIMFEQKYDFDQINQTGELKFISYLKED